MISAIYLHDDAKVLSESLPKSLEKQSAGFDLVELE
jgi:hypothetical protein